MRSENKPIKRFIRNKQGTFPAVVIPESTYKNIIKDKMRLDWISKQHEFELKRYYLEGVEDHATSEYEIDLGVKIFRGKYPRQVIDRAIKVERKEKSEVSK